MAKKAKQAISIEQYKHSDKERLNNPPVGLVNKNTDKETGQKKKKYEYDPHLDPQLQWAGKAEHTSFEVPTVSLHVHERIDPKSIIDTVKKEGAKHQQMSLFEQHDKPLREAIEFYKHKEGWTNRLIAGDSLLVMNSLLEKEGMAGKVQMLYFDPPYGIKYGSNFQPFIDKKDVKDGSDDDLTHEPEMIKAFRDTWELGIHSYLTYLRDRLLLARELLHESGSVFVQISDENMHHVKEILDEVFGVQNFVRIISFQKTSGQETKVLASTVDYLLWYSKDKGKVKYNQLYRFREIGDTSLDRYDMLLKEDGTTRRLSKKEVETGIIDESGKRYQLAALYSDGASSKEQAFEFEGKIYKPRSDTHWKTTLEGMKKLAEANRIEIMGSVLRYRRFVDDFPVIPITDRWESMMLGTQKNYVVETSYKVIQNCILMTTNPGDIVFDITCGSGTSAFAAEQWGRRWITCDTSRIALTLAKQRLMTSNFDYYQLARLDEGISGGFNYKTVPHITLKSIANNEPPGEEVLYDQPKIDSKKTRITGPFTVESIPAPFVKDLEGALESEMEADKSVTRTGETLRQDQWRDELARTGVRAKGGAMIEFSRMEAISGTKYIQAQGETKPALSAAEGGGKPEQVLVVFGPEHAPLEQRTVELAIDEARYMKPDILLFCAFQFDEEAAKDIDEIPEASIGFKLLKAQMNMDLQTEDLKKNRNTNQSFWLIGQPDVRLHEITDGEDKGMVRIEVMGFDYFNPKNGSIESGGKKNIAMWLLDTDYDGRSLFPKQVFFPMAGATDGWAKLAKNLKAEIDEEKIEAFRGTESLPFAPGKQIAIKIIDDRGIESLKIITR
ncbi:site-specific DNA-methyltransferase [Perlabentimonas gracilis]|uniref:site-specific DNA-methyltransferase n=1 Tax=Perlabentimonas gracilis TaxID=2715279 RepID=UPI00140910B9|nr:site-specific DNA-methyltransferase [Perlabentimonas gracilis]NHB68903.1 site-specific DNA-methyltransferase [Perlabentimonas gracilis]